MLAKEIQATIDNYHYWDARVLSLSCNYFADEVELIYEDEDDFEVVYRFLECYKTVFDHVITYDKFAPVRKMTLPQLPYFLQSVEIGEKVESDVELYTCKINMFPLELEVWCKDIEVIKQKKVKPQPWKS